ncbi:hypothetical protein An07g04340 [Aspergillus niger]|uniref:Uncharacterized protein n=2 Tax=Aspergillus niger TaxID=5061 RepID=A2QN43_ASPNC|nr:hypothetical protein An07g04340 [Aspergillus niger]CAK48184.1 hypothetical protein An07g04340 [Aspergillus niger]
MEKMQRRANVFQGISSISLTGITRMSRQCRKKGNESESLAARCLPALGMKRERKARNWGQRLALHKSSPPNANIFGGGVRAGHNCLSTSTMEPEYPEYPEPSQRGKSANLLEPFKSEYRSKRWREWLFDITEELDSGNESDGSKDTIFPDLPRDGDLSKLIQNSDSWIKQAADLIADNQISIYDQGRSDSASSPVILDYGGLPKEPRMPDLAPGRLAFRKPGDAFCREQHLWRGIIESEKHQAPFEELRWAIRLGGWKNGDPEENLTQLIETRSAGIKNIKAKIHAVTNADGQLLQKMQDFASRIEKTESSKSKLPPPRVVEQSLSEKRIKADKAAHEYQIGISTLVDLEEGENFVVSHLEGAGDGIEDTSGQAKEATGVEEDANDEAEGHVDEGDGRVQVRRGKSKMRRRTTKTTKRRKSRRRWRTMRHSRIMTKRMQMTRLCSQRGIGKVSRNP